VLAALADPAAQEDDEGYGELVEDLRERGYDPAAFDVKQLDAELSALPLRRMAAPAAKVSRAAARGRGLELITPEDLEFCTCGQCRAGDPVRSVLDIAFDGEADEALDDAELLPAATLLDVLPAYDSDAAERETAGWLTRRSLPDAAVQLLDACAGMDAEASGRRRMALSLLARSVNADERALRVLRKAAASDVEGCRQIAAGALNLLGEEVPGHDETTTMVWLMIDNLVLPEAAGPEDVAAFLTGEGGQVRDRLPEPADVLWRSDHPATAEVLGMLGEAVRSVDKKLAKRLRTSANKARSHR
jgi:hypothetical protein